MLTAVVWTMRVNTHPHLAGESKESGRKYRISSNGLLTKCVEMGRLPGASKYLFLYQNGEIEDVYWTLSYSPAYGDNGNVNGAFVTCTETSGKINVLRKSEESNSQLAFTIEPVGLGAFDFIPLTDIFSSNRIS